MASIMVGSALGCGDGFSVKACGWDGGWDTVRVRVHVRVRIRGVGVRVWFCVSDRIVSWVKGHSKGSGQGYGCGLEFSVGIRTRVGVSIKIRDPLRC